MSRRKKMEPPPRVVQTELLALTQAQPSSAGDRPDSAAPEKLNKPDVTDADLETDAAAGAPPPMPPPLPPYAGAERARPVHAPGPLGKLVDDNFLQFASYTICHRAIPTVEDGLKPVQRRILHALSEKDDGRFVKVANIVGHTMQYHPHGDASIGDALVALVNKTYLIEGQGNFGNVITGDSAAAARYIECRLTPLARAEMFDPDLTDYAPSYDGRNKEPTLLPARIPVLLMIGADGIAVGLSTRIFPHNFIDLLEAQICILRHEHFTLVPDFPNGGLMDVSEYDKGSGRIRLRAEIEPHKNGHLVIKSIPFGSTTESLIASIEEAVRKKQAPVRAISDYTAESVEINLTLSPGASPEKAIAALYAFTSCETAITGIPVVLHNNRPREMDTHAILRANTERLLDTLIRQLNVRKGKIKEDILNKTLVQIFVEHRLYTRIENCATYEAVHEAVREGVTPFLDRFHRALTRDDIEMLLGVRIRRISQFDIDKNRGDIEQLEAELAEVERCLAAPVRYAIAYLKRLIRDHKDLYPRRTEIRQFDTIELRTLAATQVTIHRDENGYIGTKLQGEALFTCSSLDRISLVWDTGAYKVIQPPEKLFVDTNLVYAARFERDRVMTLVYQHNSIAYLKRFTFGGAIMNRDYSCVQEPAKVLLFTDETIERLYVKYRPAKGQRIHRQLFDLREMPVKGVKARGNQMTAKPIARLSTTKPKWWDDESEEPPGVLFTP